MAATTIKTLLSDTETVIFTNWDDINVGKVIAKSISVCNTKDSALKVWLSFVYPGGTFEQGVILSGFSLDANTTKSVDISNRVLNVDESIVAYAEAADLVSLSVDVEGLTGIYEPSLPLPPLRIRICPHSTSGFNIIPVSTATPKYIPYTRRTIPHPNSI